MFDKSGILLECVGLKCMRTCQKQAAAAYGVARLQAFKTFQLGGKTSELLYSPATYGVDFGAQNMIKPRARRNPLMTVHGNVLWMLGGIVEVCCLPISAQP